MERTTPPNARTVEREHVREGEDESVFVVYTDDDVAKRYGTKATITWEH